LIKRLFDLSVAFIGILILLPVFVAIGLLVKLTSNGPVFYRGVRTGLNGIPFQIFKFRTMVAEAEQLGGPSTARNDFRLTSLGRWLRRYKLDELPQLINILKGEMSFVGPRPQVEQYTRLYSGEEHIILSIRPGLTDYASIHFINMDDVLGDHEVDRKYLDEVEPVKNQLRIRYVKERTFFVDMKILMKTIARLFRT